jgi:hypothetical protein
VHAQRENYFSLREAKDQDVDQDSAEDTVIFELRNRRCDAVVYLVVYVRRGLEKIPGDHSPL